MNAVFGGEMLCGNAVRDVASANFPDRLLGQFRIAGAFAACVLRGVTSKRVVIAAQDAFGMLACSVGVAARDSLGATARPMIVAFGDAMTALRDLVAVVRRTVSEKQVLGSNAGWVVAVVQDAHAGGYRAVVQFPRYAVRSLIASAAIGNAAVSPLVTRRSPYPAITSGIDLRPETFSKRAQERLLSVAAILPRNGGNHWH